MTLKSHKHNLNRRLNKKSKVTEINSEKSAKLNKAKRSEAIYFMLSYFFYAFQKMELGDSTWRKSLKLTVSR